jgi:GT2 family glycosyltransferase
VAADVSAVVVAFHHPAPLVAELLGALARQTRTPHEVILVDNAGDAALEEPARDAALKVRVIRPPRNLGYVGACNLAGCEAAGEWLWFVNPDALPAPSALERLLAAADAGTALVGAQILLPGGDRVNAGDNGLHVSGLSWAGRYGEPREDGPPRDVAVASGACLAVRAVDFERLGGYHGGYFLYHDDVDLAWRARLAGRRVRFVPAATAVHDYDFHKGGYKWYWLERNRLWTVLSAYDARTLAALAPVLLFAELGILAFSIREGWWREKLRSWRTLWRERRELRAWRARVQRTRQVSDAELVRWMQGRLDTPLLSAPGLSLAGSAIEGYRRALLALGLLNGGRRAAR